jgi:hypothetical protein
VPADRDHTAALEPLDDPILHPGELDAVEILLGPHLQMPELPAVDGGIGAGDLAHVRTPRLGAPPVPVRQVVLMAEEHVIARESTEVREERPGLRRGVRVDQEYRSLRLRARSVGARPRSTSGEAGDQRDDDERYGAGTDCGHGRRSKNLIEAHVTTIARMLGVPSARRRHPVR